jgi:hypothetical protein
MLTIYQHHDKIYRPLFGLPCVSMEASADIRLMIENRSITYAITNKREFTGGKMNKTIISSPH